MYESNWHAVALRAVKTKELSDVLGSINNGSFRVSKGFPQENRSANAREAVFRVEGLVDTLGRKLGTGHVLEVCALHGVSPRDRWLCVLPGWQFNVNVNGHVSYNSHSLLPS